jgi:hypothetical protein
VRSRSKRGAGEPKEPPQAEQKTQQANSSLNQQRPIHRLSLTASQTAPKPHFMCRLKCKHQRKNNQHLRLLVRSSHPGWDSCHGKRPVLLAAVRPTQWQLQYAFHGTAALLQVADGISGLNDINIDIEASQVEASPFQRVTLLCIQWEKKGGTYSGCCLGPGRQASRHSIRMLRSSLSQPAVSSAETGATMSYPPISPQIASMASPAKSDAWARALSWRPTAATARRPESHAGK